MYDAGQDQLVGADGQRNARLLMASAGLGALLGLLSGYLYTRGSPNDDGVKISTRQMLSLLLKVVGLLREIAELGKSKE